MAASLIGPPRNVIQIGIISEETTLAPLLSSVLGSEFLVIGIDDPERTEILGSDIQFDAFILDYASSTTCNRACARLFQGGAMPATAPVLILADDEDRRKALDLVERGAHGYVRKPPAVRELRAMLRSAYERRLLKGELAAVRRQLENTMGLDQITGSSAQMQFVYKLVRKVASLDASVLITGE